MEPNVTIWHCVVTMLSLLSDNKPIWFSECNGTLQRSESVELPQARACGITASSLQSIKLPILQIPPGPRGSKEWRLQGSIPRSRDPNSKDPSSRHRELLVSIGEALGLLSLAMSADVQKGAERSGKLPARQPASRTPGDPWISKDFH